MSSNILRASLQTYFSPSHFWQNVVPVSLPIGVARPAEYLQRCVFILALLLPSPCLFPSRTRAGNPFHSSNLYIECIMVRYFYHLQHLPMLSRVFKRLFPSQLPSLTDTSLRTPIPSSYGTFSYNLRRGNTWPFISSLLKTKEPNYLQSFQFRATHLVTTVWPCLDWRMQYRSASLQYRSTSLQGKLIFQALLYWHFFFLWFCSNQTQAGVKNNFTAHDWLF